MPPLLQYAGASKSFGPVRALDGLTLELEPGQVCGLVGENGAGKTTALSLATGLLKPDSGRVRLFGHDPVTEPGAAKRGLGYIPDRPHAPPRLSGREYLRFTAALWGADPAEADAFARPLVERLDLSDRYDERLETYSHGMRQKLVIAAQLAHRPSLILMDEPLVGLDLKAARVLRELILSRSAEGAAVLLSSHAVSLVESVCGRVAVLSRGRLAYLGSVAEAVAAFGGGIGLEEALLRIGERAAEA